MLLFLVPSVLASIKDITEEMVQEEFNRTGKLPLFVEFWSPWCEHCQRLAPIFQKISEAPQFAGKIEFGRFDCNQYNKYCTKNYHGTPSFLYLKTDEQNAVPFASVENYDNLYFFLEKQLYNYLGVLETPEDINKVITDADHGSTFIFSLADGDQTALDIALNVSNTLKFTDFRCFRTKSNSPSSSLVAYRSRFHSNTFNREWTLTNVYDFLQENVEPFLTQFSSRTVRHATKSKLLCAVIVVDRRSDVDEFFATPLKSYSQVQYAYLIRSPAPRLLEHVGLTRRKPPFAFVVNITQDVWWIEAESFSRESLYRLIDVALSDASLAHAIGRGAPNNTVLDRFRFWCYDTIGPDQLFFGGIALVTIVVIAIVALPLFLSPRPKEKSQ